MKVLVAGDFVPRNRIASMIEKKIFSFFDEVVQINKECDYSILNFESPVVSDEATPIIKTGPNIKCNEYAMQAVHYAGFDCVTLANNHFYDFGDMGVTNTIDSCKRMSIDYVGGGLNINEATKVLYKSIKNKKLAIINVCESEWSIATENQGGASPLDIIDNVRMIKQAKNQADYIILIVHGGVEHYQLPSPRMKKTYRFFIEAGVDAVINHHQHCFSGFEIYLGKPIFYGLGNFCFDRNNPNDSLWNEGYAVELNLTENDVSFRILPYIQCSITPNVTFIKNHKDFERKISLLNSIINDDAALLESFINMARDKCFMQFLEPYNNKYLQWLRSKELLPSFLNLKRKNMILELFRCESHRDIMFELLKR